MHAIILSIGDELVLGQTVDTNSAYLSAQLAAHGIGTLFHQTIADDQQAIVDALQYAAARGPLIIVTGGLGPTEDDLTRQALAQALGVDLVVHEPSVEAIRAMLEKRGRKMAERNKVQALHPRGSRVLPNRCGTAPGLHAQLGAAQVYVMPGVPREMYDMWAQLILPDILQHGPSRGVILTLKVNTFGLGESVVGEKLGALMDRGRNPKVGTTVADGLVSVRIRSEFPDRAAAQRELDATLALVQQALGASVFGCESDTLQQALLTELQSRGRTLAVAESCTGGLVGALITEVPGSSAAFRGGWITYSNELKHSQLGVPRETLAHYGAVSGETAQAMALGALERSGATDAVALTGIAGPDGGTDDKPVGTVWIGLARREGGQARAEAQRYLFSGARDMVRDRAAKTALQLLRLQLLGAMPEDFIWRVQPALTNQGR